MKERLRVRAARHGRSMEAEVRAILTDAVAEPGEALFQAIMDRFGLPIDGFDAQIAAICRTRGAALATRNAKDFRETGIDLIDPWQDDGRTADSPITQRHRQSEEQPRK